MTAFGWLPFVGSVGLTLVVATGRLFRPLRDGLAARPGWRWAGALLSCSMCTGFWVGVGSAARLGLGPEELLWYGGAVSLAGYAADIALRRLAAGED